MYFFQIISNLVEMKTSKVLASLCLGLVSVSIQDVPRNMIFEFSHGISTNRSAFFVLSILPNIFRSLFRFQFWTLFPLGGGWSIWPPVVFFYITQSIGLSLLKFSDFSYIPKALTLGLKLGFNTNCLSPQAHCLNDCFCL